MKMRAEKTPPRMNGIRMISFLFTEEECPTKCKMLCASECFVGKSMEKDFLFIIHAPIPLEPRISDLDGLVKS